MLYCYGQGNSVKEQEEINYKKAQIKLANKIRAIEFLIRDARISNSHKIKLIETFNKASIIF